MGIFNAFFRCYTTSHFAENDIWLKIILPSYRFQEKKIIFSKNKELTLFFLSFVNGLFKSAFFFSSFFITGKEKDLRGRKVSQKKIHRLTTYDCRYT